MPIYTPKQQAKLKQQLRNKILANIPSEWKSLKEFLSTEQNFSLLGSSTMPQQIKDLYTAYKKFSTDLQTGESKVNLDRDIDKFKQYLDYLKDPDTLSQIRSALPLAGLHLQTEGVTVAIGKLEAAYEKLTQLNAHIMALKDLRKEIIEGTRSGKTNAALETKMRKYDHTYAELKPQFDVARQRWNEAVTAFNQDPAHKSLDPRIQQSIRYMGATASAQTTQTLRQFPEFVAKDTLLKMHDRPDMEKPKDLSPLFKIFPPSFTKPKFDQKDFLALKLAADDLKLDLKCNSEVALMTTARGQKFIVTPDSVTPVNYEKMGGSAQVEAIQQAAKIFRIMHPEVCSKDSAADVQIDTSKIEGRAQGECAMALFHQGVPQEYRMISMGRNHILHNTQVTTVPDSEKSWWQKIFTSGARYRVTIDQTPTEIPHMFKADTSFNSNKLENIKNLAPTKSLIEKENSDKSKYYILTKKNGHQFQIDEHGVSPIGYETMSDAAQKPFIEEAANIFQFLHPELKNPQEPDTPPRIQISCYLNLEATNQATQCLIKAGIKDEVILAGIRSIRCSEQAAASAADAARTPASAVPAAAATSSAHTAVQPKRERTSSDPGPSSPFAKAQAQAGAGSEGSLASGQTASRPEGKPPAPPETQNTAQGGPPPATPDATTSIRHSG